MKVICYMATSINGYITEGSDDSDWVSDLDWKVFDKLLRECKVVVMGARTFKLFEDDFPQEGALNIVMTHSKKLLGKEIPGAILTNKSPKEVVAMVKRKGYKQLMLIGGMALNTSFLKAGLINEIWLDVHPLLIGEGKTIFDKLKLFKKLELIESKKLGYGQVLLKYKLIS